MLTRKIRAGLMSAVVALGVALSGQAMADITVQEATVLDAAAKDTLTKFKAETVGAEAVIANAKGVLVCPKITKGGFIIGVQGGECVLYSGAPPPLYYSTNAVKVGFLAGIQSYSMILALNTDSTRQVHEWRPGVGGRSGCLGGDSQNGRGRFTGYHESEAGRCGVHLWRERADGGFVLGGLTIQEARPQVTS